MGWTTELKFIHRASPKNTNQFTRQGVLRFAQFPGHRNTVATGGGENEFAAIVP